MDEEQQQTRNHGTAWRLALLVGGMFGFGFAMVPLYGLICQVTGIQTAAVARQAAVVPVADGADGRMVTVKFDATVNDDLPWEFEPVVRSMTVPVGAMQRVSYTARNRSALPVTGQAIPAVVPWQVNDYLRKAECFCFRQQTLQAGETREMPLTFMVAPELPTGVETLTLSYTFMNADAAHNPRWERYE